MNNINDIISEEEDNDYALMNDEIDYEQKNYKRNLSLNYSYSSLIQSSFINITYYLNNRKVFQNKYSENHISYIYLEDVRLDFVKRNIVNTAFLFLTNEKIIIKEEDEINISLDELINSSNNNLNIINISNNQYEINLISQSK